MVALSLRGKASPLRDETREQDRFKQMHMFYTGTKVSVRNVSHWQQPICRDSASALVRSMSREGRDKSRYPGSDSAAGQ